MKCGETKNLEFHEVFGEDHKGKGKMQMRELLCPACHDKEHEGERIAPTENPNPSMLSEDVEEEMQMCGGLSSWAELYMLKIESFGVRLT